MAYKKVSRVKDAVDKLITKKVIITVFGGAPNCSGDLCLYAKWGRGKAPLCPLHKPGHKNTTHACVIRQVVGIVYSIDAGAAVLPEFGMKGHVICKRSGPMFYVDVMFVLSNGMPLAVEVDGSSHKNGDVKKSDAQKHALLHACNIRLIRIDLMQSTPEQLYELGEMVTGLV